MDFNGLITIAGLFVAIYAVLPRVRRLEISLSFGIFGKISLFIVFITLFYIQFYHFFRTLNMTPGWNLARWGITPSNTSAFIVISETIIIIIYFKFNGLNRFSIHKYKEYIFQLIEEKSYTELFRFLNGKIRNIYKVYTLENYRERKSNLFDTIRNKIIKNKLKNKLNIVDLDGKSIISTIYRYKEPKLKSTHATEIIQELTNKDSVVESIAKNKPYFAIELLKYDFRDNHDFIETYLTSLAKLKNGVLYHELKNTNNITSSYEYIIPENMRLLHFFFSNCEIAQKYAVYRPIGEFVLNYLDDLYVSEKPDKYNEPMRDFQENGKWQSELFLGIHFFDKMIGAALAQNIKWHMWLYYFKYFVERIIKNLDPNQKLIDPLDEWPTRYHYAIYEIFDCLCKWITSVEKIDLDQENVKLDSIDTKHENGNIPKSSMIVVGQILEIFLLTDKLNMRFKSYIMEMLFRRYFTLIKKNETKPYAHVLKECIATASNAYKLSEEYKYEVVNQIKHIDKFHYDFTEYEDLKNYFEDQLDTSVSGE